MKLPMKSLSGILLLICVAVSISSCRTDTNVSTIVHEDGSLDRTVVLSMADSSSLRANQFGISSSSGWSVESSTMTEEEIDKMNGDSNKGNLRLRYTKHFASTDEANEEMNTDNDTLFHIRSSFEKKFRWFYTYYSYSDTYANINRFHHIAADDFFTQEDHAFINRLSPDGQKLSRADSIYLKWLNSKIEDDFFRRGAFEEYYVAFQEILKNNQVDARWLDTLDRYKETVYQYEIELGKKRNGDNPDDDDTEFLFRIADSLHIPIAMAKAKTDFVEKHKMINARLVFMEEISTGSFQHSVELPGTIINANADSVAGNRAYWKPRYLKFGLTDYTMYAEYRSLNYLPLAVSVLVIAATVAMLLRRRKISSNQV